MRTHCNPAGDTDPTRITVPNVSDANMYVIPQTAGANKTRGVIVWLHGGPLGPITVPYPITGATLTWANTQAADGWHSVIVTYPEDFVPQFGLARVHEDVAADAGHGSRFLTMTLAWWDHVVEWLYDRFGEIPIVLNGGSWGGWHTLQLMKNKPTGIAGFICSIAAVKLTGIVDAVGGKTWSTLNSTGADNASSCLNAITVPGVIQVMLGDGTTDTVVNVPDQIAVKDAAIAAVGAAPTGKITYIGSAGTHISTPPYSSYTTWITGVLDPLCPQSFP